MRYFMFRMKRFCGFAVGFVFYISGILKLMDPVGAGLVMKEYFHFLHIGFMDFSAQAAGILFAFTEAIIGAGLITGVWRKIVAPVSICFQGFFTFLTLLLLIFNPEMDCGCFGEAIHLTHAQTFVKNIVLLILLLTYYVPAKYLGQTKKRKYVSFGVVTISTLVFTIYSCMHLPLTDFTDYHVGASLRASESSAGQIYDAVFVYEKDGIQQQFSIEDIPDSTWTFIKTESVLKDEKVEDVTALSFYDENGNYADTIVMNGKVMIISIYNPAGISIRRLSRFIKTSEDNGFRTLVLSTQPVDGLDGAEQYASDRKTLMTLNRSNGGATLVSNGLIARKWSKKSLPDTGELAKISQENVTETIIDNSHNSLAFQGFMLYVFAVMLLL